jgi:predicted ester cyclase
MKFGGERNFSLIPELIASDYVGTNVYGVFKGRDGYEQIIKTATANIPDIQYTVDEVIGEGDTLMAKVTMTGTINGKIGDLEISGKKIKTTSVFVNKYENGKIRESTVYGNPLEMLKQLEVPIPPEWGMG